MSMQEILATVRGFEGVVVLSPTAGSEYPEIAWGDHFVSKGRSQPYATIVTKNYPEDTASDLDPSDRWRLNIKARTETDDTDPTEPDRVHTHPTYRGWIAIVTPGERTLALALRLLREAHDAAR